jgi:tetratricopeptide (TPR) repeat protein
MVITGAVVLSGRCYLIVGWLWYALTLLPVSGLVPSGFEAMADRWTYVPLIGLSIAIAWGAEEVMVRSPPVIRLAAGAVAATALVATLACSWSQARYWRDSITLYEHSLRAAPDPPILHYNLANALDRKGRTDEAIRHYRQAVRLQPRYSEAHNNLGAALLARGRTDEAIEECREATRVDPMNAEAHNNLGRALEVRGRVDEAIAAFREAVRVRPTYALGHFNLGRVLHARGQLDEAIAEYRTALRLEPDFGPAQSGLRVALRRRGS